MQTRRSVAFAHFSIPIALVATAILAAPARATVTQADGSIIPKTAALQTFIDGEGENNPVATRLDAVLDASQFPERFLPNTLAPVTFKDVGEGAGFENTFGWYNIGDDVTTAVGRARNLHPILGCDTPVVTNVNPNTLTDAQLLAAPNNQRQLVFMPGATPPVTPYVLNAEPGSSVTVDFAYELTAGRYKGGFIGFYLVTPEGNQYGDGCGDIKQSATDATKSKFGKIYYSEADLNNDGDFVHNLVYTSKKTTDRFYFGFEDLFRGGDNDFEDMLTQVTGLTPPCVPQTEVCDGIDNDCDGLVDANDPTLAGVNAACTCNGVGLTCQGGNRQGACQTGVTVCTAATLSCQSTVSPTTESCNGVDDNCNGTVDDNPTGAGVACDGTDGDACNEGVTTCTSGTLTCGDTSSTNVETCNGLDDDCDGQTDEGNPGGGVACDGADGDLCAEGITTCTNGAIACSDNSTTNVETCNGLDDDCDGMIDESPTGVGVACSVGVGSCRRNGATVCQGGVPVCNVSPGAPSSELCNNLDDDCDGQVDEDYNVGQTCDGVGACGAGVFECRTLTSTACSTDVGGSNPGATPETCNGLDDDCDGQVDEGLNNLGSCGIATGECAQGSLRCIAGAPQCIGSIGPTPEVCDQKDNDCDGRTDERTGQGGDTNGGLVDEGATCGNDTGRCDFGHTVCVTGALQCQGGVGPIAEICNGQDDDCDGIVDDQPTDVGVACGATSTGECTRGLTICTGGTIQCNGEQGPTVETCNGLDDDCDGSIDDDPLLVGTPCTIAGGTVCAPGAFACVSGSLICQGASTGTPETCNGIDDDCNGFVDDNVPGLGVACGSSIGACDPGHTACIAGSVQCVGGVTPITETCNNLDDDCDGNVDNGDLCTPGVCVMGVCLLHCAGGEFDCPPGSTCQDTLCVPDKCFNVSCPTVNGVGQGCDPADGSCRPLCELNPACPTGVICRPLDGQCVEDNCLNLPERCTAAELCAAGTCIANPCLGVTCPEADQFCRGGTCVESCGAIDCPEGQLCHDGVCSATGCTGDCGAGNVCNPTTHECGADPCLHANCTAGNVCNPSTGDCELDRCLGIVCPAGQTCREGDCFLPPGGTPDAAPPEAVYATGGGGGCAIAAGGGSGGSRGAWILGVLLGSALVWRRRKILLAAALLVVASCNVDPYYIYPIDAADPVVDAGVVHDGDGSVLDGDGAVIDVDAAQADACVATTEVCDGLDNDCDTLVDEDFDLTQDELNCGVCGKVCSKTGARTQCTDSVCDILECFPGNVDVDHDIDLPFDQSNGCEYACFVSNGGVEVCDALDNDCDGAVDEDTDKQNDEDNCGSCGHVCQFFHADATCTGGTCGFDPATACDVGFHDANHQAVDGCEYACTPSNGGVEICDYIDNDCDGMIDEIFSPSTDPNNCGACGRVCSFPHATPHCASGACRFDPASDCAAGFHDANGTQLDGCEYACTPTNGGVEICDGIDNDCDQIVDDNPSGTGASCNKSPSGTATGICTQTGVIQCVAGALECVGAPGPRSERCNGLDDDCDGQSDDSPVDVGAVCQAPVGNCSAGIERCVAGALVCQQAIGPSPELCNGLDDDCDGQTDETPTDPSLGQPCGTDTGECSRGINLCTGGAIVCSAGVGPTAELCNGLDDDCNGVVDNNPIDALGSCGSDVGICVSGTEVCTNGHLVCSGATPPASSESCNNQDDDCDGQTDEGISAQSCYTGGAGTLNVGACHAGSASCVSGSFGTCVGQVTPVAETCNNIDDNCNGVKDEGVSQVCYTGAAGTVGVGRCVSGLQACVNGAFTGACVGQIVPAAESCNGLDDDCDGQSDEAAGGGPLSQSCYDGPAGTAGVGTCHAGTQTCAAGAFGVCSAEVVPAVDRCSNGLNEDCDGQTDESCLATQNVELRLDESPGSGGSNAGEFHSFDPAAASAGATLGKNVYVVWSDNKNGNTDVFLRRSTDAGATWQNVQNLTSGISDACVDPQVVAAFDATLAADRVYVVFQRVNGSGVRRVAFVRSVNSGGAFSDSGAGNIISNDSAAANNDAFHAHVATSADGTRVSIVWEQLDTGTLARTVRGRASTDSGATLGADRLINVSGGTVAGRPQTAVTGNGRFLYVWREARVGATFDIYANFATDTGSALTAGNEKRLDGDTGQTRQSDLPRVIATNAVAGNQNVYVVWQDGSTAPGGGSDVVFARSTSAGTSWNAETIIDDPASEVSSSFVPVIDVDPATSASNSDDLVYLAWEDRREGAQIYAARSTDAGASFGAAVRASNQGGSTVPGVSTSPRLAFVGGNTVVIAYANTATSGARHIRAAASIDDAVTWQVSDVVVDGGNGPTVSPVLTRFADTAAPTLGAVVVWIDNRTGTGVNGDPYRRRYGR
jgi:Notch-like protein